MEPIDRALQQRVWQRVQGKCDDPSIPTAQESAHSSPGPEGLLLDELTDGAVFRLLAGKTKEPAASMLRRLAQHTGTQAAALRGICQLSGVPSPTLTPNPSKTDRTDLQLRWLMGRLLRRTREYRNLCDHPEFGILYEALAQNSRDAALLLAQTIGK